MADVQNTHFVNNSVEKVVGGFRRPQNVEYCITIRGYHQLWTAGTFLENMQKYTNTNTQDNFLYWEHIKIHKIVLQKIHVKDHLWTVGTCLGSVHKHTIQYKYNKERKKY